MKKLLLIFSVFAYALLAQAQTNEYYLKIKINSRSELEELTRLVSIDNVKDLTVLAYANDNELEGLKKRSITFELLPHPSSDPAKVINMATTVQEMANWNRYPTYQVYVQMMQNYAANYPELCKLDTIGTSVQGRLLLTLKISDNAHQNEAEPQVWYNSTMHGDETTGFVLLLRLIDYFLTGYGTNSRITNLLNNLEIFISPNTNPDGTYYGGNTTVASARRANFNGVDLNRDFPDPRGENAPYARETQLIMNYAGRYRFIHGANFHGGIELVNYPWDTWTTAQNPHADANWYYTISRQYADIAQANSPAGYMTGQNNGVTQGGDWYVIMGGRQDYMNYFHHCKEITIEISNTKLLSSDLLPAHWNYNREAMLTHIELALYGIRGFVTNPNGEALSATVKIIGYDKDNSHVITNPRFGNYYRMLLPGTYSLKFESYGYIPQTISNVTVAANQVTPLNVVLQPATLVNVTGNALDATNGQPLAGVTVSISNSPISPVTTNSNGIFTIQGVTEGVYEFVFVKTGYITKKINVNVSPSMQPIAVVMSQFSGFSFENGQIPHGFTFSGNQPWSVISGIAYDGNHSLKSGTIGHSQSSTVTYTFTTGVAGNVSFFVKVSSESNYDKFKFYINNVEKVVLSGEVNWTERSFPVAVGQHTLKWEYSKDISVSSGQDAAWIDFISIPGANTIQNPIPLVTPRTILHNTEQAQSSATISITNIGNGTLTFTTTVEDAVNHTWLTLTNPNGSLLANQNATIMLNFNLEAKETIEKHANVLINVVDSVISIPVTVVYNYTSIENSTENRTLIYPNPSSDFVTICLTENTPAHIAIYSIDGKIVGQAIISAPYQRFEISELGIFNKGIYLVEIQTAKERIVKKIAIQ